MATYATEADYLATIEGAVVGDSAALERILVRAERDVDRVLGPLRPREDTGLKLDPATDLAAHERAALARAVAHQAEHRMTLGEGAGGTPDAIKKRVKGPDFEVEYDTAAAAATAAAGPLSPRVADELYVLRRLRPIGARARA